ncbi:MAG: ABC transporter ATP-binding protein/permease [Comamonas sp.]|nr:ABC transporter ATP-binding protein/permease [Comamonas sp.]
MRRGSDLPPSPVSSGVPAHSQWRTLGRLVPYLWAYKWRVLAAIALMVAAKSANVGVPLLLKQLIDTLDVPAGDARALLVVPVGLLLAYGALRFGNSLFNELRELVFAKATHGAARSIALSTFEHLHALSLRFHLERQTGGMTRDIERGVRGIESLVSFALFNIVATFIEVLLVLTVLGGKLDIWFAIITLCALGGYILFTVLLTEWRIQFRRQANQFDSAASTKAVDSLINYETVKYFNNEAFEAQRYDVSLQQLRAAQLKSRSTLALLNGGQQLIIAIGLVAMLWRATQGVVDGRLTLGDLVMVNAFMIQIYIPLNFLGVIYREIKQNLTDLDRMFTLMDQPQEVADAPNAQPLALRPDAPPSVRFDNVYFAYDPKRPILQGISLEIPAGKTVAVVGASGAGKSTLSRLLYRFYDIQQGRITIDEQDIAQVTQASLRRAIGIVPQDTVLFNDTIAYNIAYGRPGATQQEIEQAARAARIHDFIVAQPQGYATQVGERGLKLSGGEKQRVAIARTLLKNPPILIFDEATSALDSANERAIQNELRTVAQGKTTLVVAHRLSTVVEAHEILVMDAGRIIERGSHSQLLAQGGRYASMWALQQEAA